MVLLMATCGLDPAEVERARRALGQVRSVPVRGRGPGQLDDQIRRVVREALRRPDRGGSAAPCSAAGGGAGVGIAGGMVWGWLRNSGGMIIGQ